MTHILLLLLLPLLLASSTPGRRTNTSRSLSLQPIPELMANLYRQYDVLFLGESHRIKQQVEFVSSLIPVLQEQGVHVLFYEFTNYSDTRLSDSLLTAPDYNEKLVYDMLRRSEWDWAWQEYADNFRAAWEVNRHRKAGEPPFRIIGVMPDINYEAIQTPEDWNNDDKKRAFWDFEHNKTWLQVIETEALDRGQKALVYCGLHHAFSKFRHPIVIDGKFIRFENDREGTACYLKYPARTATIYLYAPLSRKPELGVTFMRPFNGVIDSVTASLPQKQRTYGFITTESPLGNRTDTLTYYSMGYGSIRLKDLADAVIVPGPVDQYQTATLIPGFIEEKDLPEVIRQAWPYEWTRDWTVKSANDTLARWCELEKETLIRMKSEE